MPSERLSFALRYVSAALGWWLGLFWQMQQSDVWAPMQSWPVAVVAVAGLALGWRCLQGFPWASWCVCGTCAATAAFALAHGVAAVRLDDRLSPALEGQDVVITGVVAELPRVSPLGTRFTFDVESAPPGVPSRLSLGAFQSEEDAQPFSGGGTAFSFVAGDRWRLTVRLKQPHGLFNPHGFDLELWMFEQGIGATGSVRPGAQRLDTAVAHPIERARQTVRDALLRQAPDRATAGVLAALAIGDQAAIGRDDWDLFRITGVAHLMSISGLHVTMFAWLASAVIGACWKWAARGGGTWPLHLPAPVARRWGGWLCATAYALLAGWGVPAQRTVLMIGTVAVLRSLGLRWPQPLIVLNAGLTVTLLDPWALLQPGFWLSFVAVGVLVASDPVSREAAPSTGLMHKVRGELRTQLIATVGLAPLSMVFFQQISIVGFLANLVAIPWVTLIVTPLTLLGILLPALWWPAAWSVQGLHAVLAPMASWPAAQWSAPVAPVWASMGGLLGGVLLIMPIPWRLRCLGLALCLPLLVPAVWRPAAGEFEAVAADVGQGTAVLVRTRHHLLVYDTGPQTSAESDAGQRVLVPLLRARGEERVHRLVLSHRDIDHTGGTLSLLKAVTVESSLSSLSDTHPLRTRLPAHERCRAGQQWAWDGVNFEVLHPQASDYDQARKSNALSCVIKVTDAQGRRLLLTGDIESAQEADLLRRDPERLKAEALLVPHHGSRTSSTRAFLEAVDPQVAVVQAGYRSRFGHPAPDVVARYDSQSITLVRTDQCGAYTWPQARCERQAQQRYWHHRPQTHLPPDRLATADAAPPHPGSARP